MKKATLALLLVFSLLLVGCSSKEAVTADDFISKMEAAGYEVHDISDQYDGSLVESYTLAIKEDQQIEFFVLVAEEDAAASFAQNKTLLEPLEGGGSVQTSVNAGNYSSYTLTTSDTYYSVSRVGNTLIYLGVPVEYKSEVSDIVKSLGY